MAEKLYQDNYRTIYWGDCRQMAELPDESVQCVVTSPPYWGLRKYTGEQELIWGDQDCQHEWGETIEITGHKAGETNPGKEGYSKDAEQWSNTRGAFCSLCAAWRGAYGLEPTPEMYIEHTIEILREIRRVLRKDGCVFWNLGDSYFSSGGESYSGSKRWQHTGGRAGAPDGTFIDAPKIEKHNSLKPKDLSLIPFRVAIAAQEDGWWVRSVIIWSKSNPMPSSAKDRPTSSHEYILMLTKSARYYWDADAVREPSNGELAEDISNLLKEAGKMGAERIRTRFMETAKDAVETALEQLDEVVKVGWEEKLSGEERALLDRLLGVWTGLTEEMRIIYLVMGIKSKQESPDDELGKVVKALENAEVISG